MPFQIKSQAQIYQDMEDYVRVFTGNGTEGSGITDFNPGSVVRTILEAATLNDVELYLQLALVKSLGNIDNLFDSDLDERALDYNVFRRAATPSVSTVRFGDSRVAAKVSTTLAGAAAAGASTVMVASTTGFPAVGYLVFDQRSAGDSERVAYTAKTANTFTLAGTLAKNHSSGGAVVLSQQGVNYTVPALTAVTSRATDTQAAVTFLTASAVVLYDGDQYSDEVVVTSTQTGTSQNVATGRISTIANPPWPTATVTNTVPAHSGVDRETDSELRGRIRTKVQTASRGTATAITNAALGVTKDNYTCRTVQLVESVDGVEPSVLYVHDGASGSEFAFNTSDSAPDVEVLVTNSAANRRRARLGLWPVVANTLNLYRSVASGTATVVDGEVVVAGGGLQAGALSGMRLIDSNKSAYTIESNTDTTITLVSGSDEPAPGLFAVVSKGDPLVEGVDYKINLSSGELQLEEGLAAGAWLVASKGSTATASYQYYTGLLAEVQKVINGDPADPTNYPGYKAFGVTVNVKPPSLAVSVIKLSITTEEGVAETDALRQSVEQAVATYVGSLGIGDALLLSELVTSCQQVPGVYDTQVISPTANVQVLPGQLFRYSSISIV